MGKDKVQETMVSFAPPLIGFSSSMVVTIGSLQKFVSGVVACIGWQIVATLLWPSVGVKPNTWKKWGFGVLRDSRMFRARQHDPKHFALGCSWSRWKGLEA